ncbi:hypothetical protein PUN28_004411 [Cardiocondyla obscurior]|uniref:Ribosomal protein L37 n=1 Tax=Cardiocondyla obscurior TaxID=286306 RepID=A0AAW2GDJ6_9HYME
MNKWSCRRCARGKNPYREGKRGWHSTRAELKYRLYVNRVSKRSQKAKKKKSHGL